MSRTGKALEQLEDIIAARLQTGEAAGSYVAGLAARGMPKIAQ